MAGPLLIQGSAKTSVRYSHLWRRFEAHNLDRNPFQLCKRELTDKVFVCRHVMNFTAGFFIGWWYNLSVINLFPPKYQYFLTTLKQLLIERGFSKKSYAQQGEDILLDSKIFSNTTKGFYVDIGACHPLQGSNTHYFYKKGWHGINVEPNPRMRKFFKLFRSRDHIETAGVAGTDGSMEYFMFAGPGVNSFDPEQVNRKKGKIPFLGSVKVPVYTLRTLFEKHSVKSIDLLSVDTEYLDLEVLQSNDWEKWRPKVVIVEYNNLDLTRVLEEPLYKFMIEKGYELFAITPPNFIFVRTR
jgi:FkbM family methyltransferase